MNTQGIMLDDKERKMFLDELVLNGQLTQQEADEMDAKIKELFDIFYKDLGA